MDKTSTKEQTAAAAVAAENKKNKCSALVFRCNIMYSEGARNCDVCSDVVCMQHATIVWCTFAQEKDRLRMRLCRDCNSKGEYKVKPQVRYADCDD
jgi:hypothetical protein